MGAKDITEKILADHNDVFADIVNGVLFDGEQIVSENTLRNAKDKSQYKFNNQIHEQERDVNKLWIPHRICFALYGFGHETDDDPFMPMRLIGYDGASYRGQLTMEVAFLDDQLDNFHSDFRIIAKYFVNKHKNTDYVPSQIRNSKRQKTTAFAVVLIFIYT